MPNPSGDSPSFEAAIEQAEAIDAQDWDEQPVKRLRKKGKANGKAEQPYQGGRVEPLAARGTEAPIPVVDIEFTFMLTCAGSMGIDWMKQAMHLREPGDLTRRKIGEALARLVQRIQPMQPGPLADVVVIVGYLGVWVLTGREDNEQGQITGETA